MAIKINHALVMTTPDDPAYENKPSNWNAALVWSGLGTNQLLYSTAATVLGQDANLTWDGTTFSAGAGTFTGKLTTPAVDFTTGVTPTKGWYSTGTNLKARLSGFDAITIDANNLTLQISVLGGTSGWFGNGNKLFFSQSAPTISSGFGSSPAVSSNGGSSYTVNVGTGGTASAGVITMPTASTGWNVHVENRTALAANRADQRTVCTASTTTSITLQNQTISTGAALAWTASDILQVIAFAY